MLAAAATMPDKETYCTYTTVKLDTELLPLLKSAAALTGKSVQEYVSDLVNEHTPKVSGRKPIKRRPPPPRKPTD